MVRSFVPAAGDIRALVRLAIPIVSVQVGLMLMGVVDTIMLGHVSSTELAAGALGNLVIYGVSGFAMGILWSADPIVAQALGARDHDAAALGVQRGLVLSVVLGVAAGLACIPVEWVFQALRQPAEVIPRATVFAHISAAGVVPMLIFITLRQSLNAMKRTSAVVGAIVAGNIVNLALNWVLVFGHLGMPALGVAGSAISTLVARFVMLGLTLVMARHELRPILSPWRPGASARGPLMKTLRLGLPIGAQNSVEYVTFAAISVFAGWFGADAISGHQIALNLASLMFMVPLGVGSAAAVLVGRAVGAGDVAHARRVAASALLAGAAWMILSACVLLAAPGLFARSYTSVPSVIAVAALLIPIAGLFQVFDGIQVVAAGVLRGAGDTRAPLIANVLGFWLMGMPVSLWLGFGAGLGVVGLWWGFVAGLAGVALFLVLRIGGLLSRPVERVRVEA
jgi:multidrug resistance protein, MATE family